MMHVSVVVGSLSLQSASVWHSLITVMPQPASVAPPPAPLVVAPGVELPGVPVDLLPLRLAHLRMRRDRVFQIVLVEIGIHRDARKHLIL